MELEAQLTAKLRIIIICIMKNQYLKDAQRLEKVLDSDLYIKLIIYMYISVFRHL